VLSVVAVKAPEKVMVPVVLVNVTVAASTVLENVVPPDLVTVTVPISVPTAPLTVTAPVVLIVKLETEFNAVPVTEDKEIGVSAPAPTVNVLLSDKVAAPIVICPVDAPPIVESPVIETVPKVITPVPAALTVPLIVLELGAVAITPPVNAVVPAKVSVPELEKVTAFVIVPPPLIATL